MGTEGKEREDLRLCIETDFHVGWTEEALPGRWLRAKTLHPYLSCSAIRNADTFYLPS